MKFINKLKAKIQQLDKIDAQQKQLKSTLDKLQESIGRVENRQLSILDNNAISDSEFRVFSQWGEDGILQYLLRNIMISHKIFVEFGVENYTESNTRFLLINNNWSGLVIDGNLENIAYIKHDPIYWQYNLKAVNSFITKDNINQLFLDNGIHGEIGLLSVDIDGNDYWVWQAINSINPVIVVSEYNFRFGATRAVTIPYEAAFVRTQAHHSNIYYGASLKALCLLANKKGYSFVGCNSAGNNAFFVRNDLKPDSLKELTPEEGYVSAQFRESRDEAGNLLYLSLEEEQKILNSLPLVDIE
ncbi:MAG: hypothetical protein MH252_12435 [Thermosynechococcaceae cyanobacterium MS004]|nr:hypothetical protein [Thermosynechococcaceae cyanobacterium MS004]